MANDKDANATSSKCSYCGDKFSNIQQCLKHELINHSLQKKHNAKNRVQKRLNATAKFLNADDKLSERSLLKKQLQKCKDGEELHEIFEVFCMKTDNLSLIFTRIQTCLEKELRSAGIVRIYSFGSIASGLALRDCDIDIFLDASDILASPRHKYYQQKDDTASQNRIAFNRINSLLHRSPHFIDVFAIRRARVPIIKCKHKDTGFSIDINISCPSSRENTQFIYDLVQSDRRIHELMLFLKLWAKNTQIIGRDNMTSYCLITMAIFFLQQPRKSAKQEKNYSDNRILKSIKELQEDCPFHMVQGINYAYDLSRLENKPKIPAAVTTWDLIKEFFNFYQNFDFEHNVISPYYGKAVEKSNLTPAISEEYYKQLNTITQYSKGEQANHLQIDRSMCVQDAFCLNHNTAKNILPQSKEYIMLCLKNAHRICDNANKINKAQLYEQLLFESIKINDQNTVNNKNKPKVEVVAELKNLKLLTNETNILNNNESKLIYTLIPSKADLRIAALRYPELTGREEILRSWCQSYVKAIETISTKIFRMDMQKQLPAQQKQQKLDEDDKNKELNPSWLISCTVDLWTSRCFQKSLKTSFISYQLEQTERLHDLRRQDPKFSVTLNGILKLNTLPNFMGLDVQLELPEGTGISSLNKKSPLRRFFNVFKNTLQSCNFKETLNVNDTTSLNNNECITDSPNSKTPSETVITV